MTIALSLIVSILMAARSATPHLNPQEAPPEPVFVPSQLVIHADSSGFASGIVKVLNRGGSPLEIRRIVPSCQCASATVQKNPIHPLEVGSMLIRVNTHAWRDSLGTVELSIETNSAPSTVRYAVTVHR